MSVPAGSPSQRERADAQDVLGAVGGSWLWALGFALVTLVPGILLLVWPNETLQVLAVIIGLQLLLAGVFGFVRAFSRDARQGGRVAGVLVALLALLAGVLCLRHPLQTIAVLSLIVGLYWLFAGILTVFVALADRELTHRGLTFVAGALGVAAGIVVLAFPVESAVALAWLLGLWLVVLGVLELVVAFALRSALRGAAGAHRT
ncbi:DUF308 domain-containing protein [Streptomyces sp. NPDC048506]|uniref:HdeD family acid-resistance protein n=1 Tax=Streptomyces sp. NPDC048506 TaxID=3155028 RepID=UPI003439F5D1